MAIKKMFVTAVGLMAALSPLTANAEHGSALDHMISPVTNPTIFEDPRPSTEIRPIFVYHKLPAEFLTGSGDAQLWAVQARFKVNDRLGIIATKDGYLQLNHDAVLPDEEGSMNLAGGLKYAFVRDDADGVIATAGLRYELASGHPRVFQGIGDGLIIPSLSAGINLDAVNLLGHTQLRLPLDNSDSAFWDLSLHADVPVGNFYPLVELNLVHVTDAGDRLPIPSEGFDVINFGASESNGGTVVVAGVGARYRICEDSLDAGVAYEFALTDREDVFDWRVTSDLIFKFDL